jgi:hypothetical protein
MENKTANIAPSWAAVANMVILGLESGTGEGKIMAREQVREMGRILDQLSAEKEKAK